MTETIIPDRGDVIWITEQPDSELRRALRAPVVVVSPSEYNASTGRAIVCPIISLTSGTPYEIKIPAGIVVSGIILADQVRSLDWQATNAIIATRLPSETIDEMLRKLRRLV